MGADDPFYGYPQDLIEPTSGGYSFIEWEDLSANTRAVMCLRRAKITFDQAQMMGVWDAILTQCWDDNHTPEQSSEFLDAAIKRWKDPSERAATEWQAARDFNDGRKWLTADPQEVKGILNSIENGVLKTTTLTCRYPVIKWTCGSNRQYSGKEFIPTSPGNMIGCIAASTAEHTDTDRYGNKVYSVEVVFKQ